MIHIEAPFTEEKIRALRVGDVVTLSGVIFTARDAVHKWLYEGNKPPVSLKNGAIYHCGPVVVKKQGRWRVVAAGPTTSIREEPYQAALIERLGLRVIIGKGGMGEKTLAACKRFGCVYLHAVGGVAQVLASKVQEVEAVYELERFGSPEAIWQLRVENFPAVVTMDASGKSLHQDIAEASALRLASILK
jgi:fumarate hydratase class I